MTSPTRPLDDCYDNRRVCSTPEEVMAVLEKGGFDSDGISQAQWYYALLDADDTVFNIIRYILKHRDDPAIRPMVQDIELAVDWVQGKS